MATTRTMHLLDGVDRSRALLLSGQPVPLRVTETRGRTVTIDFYWIMLSGQPEEWLVSKESPNGAEPVHYRVDASFGPDPKLHWECDHPRILGFSNKVATGCRHCCVVGKLLEVLR